MLHKVIKTVEIPGYIRRNTNLNADKCDCRYVVLDCRHGFKFSNIKKLWSQFIEGWNHAGLACEVCEKQQTGFLRLCKTEKRLMGVVNEQT